MVGSAANVNRGVAVSCVDGFAALAGFDGAVALTAFDLTGFDVAGFDAFAVLTALADLTALDAFVARLAALGVVGRVLDLVMATSSAGAFCGRKRRHGDQRGIDSQHAA